MVRIEILESTDKDSIGKHNIPYNNFEIGQNLNSTIRIFDKSLTSPIHIKTLASDRLTIIVNNNNGFLINNKRYYLSCQTKVGDIIKHNNLKIKISDISPSNNTPLDLKSHRKELIKQIKKHEPKNIKILESIEEDLSNLGI